MTETRIFLITLAMIVVGAVASYALTGGLPQ